MKEARRSDRARGGSDPAAMVEQLGMRWGEEGDAGHVEKRKNKYSTGKGDPLPPWRARK